MHRSPTISALTIAGSDSGGGAGIQADLKTFAAHRVHGLSAIAALTAQHTRGVIAVNVPPMEFLRAQLDACFDDFEIGAVKLGMLANAQVIGVVADALQTQRPPFIVLDPVMVATSGAKLLEEAALDALRLRLIPLASVLTPNLPEAELLLGHAITDLAAMREAAGELLALGAACVFLKGGHLPDDGDVVDLFADAAGIREIAHPRLRIEAHGTGCTLASAIAANLCLGLSLSEACAAASDYVHAALRLGYRPGRSDIIVLDHFGGGTFAMSLQALEIPLSTDDGHQFKLIARIPAKAHSSMLWLPALGVAAKHYIPLADAFAANGISVFLHEMRGNGSSNLRASRQVDWGYREILATDIARSDAAVAAHSPATTRIIGGHSIGAQFAACYLALHREAFQKLWLVASGSPYWRNFPAPKRYVFPFAYQFVPWIADLRGSLPGRRLGFGGDEARTLMRDWARVGLSNRYAAAGMETDLEAALARVEVEVRAVLMSRDWFAPRRSMQGLLDKLPRSTSTLTTLDRSALGVAADHFAWMKQPQGVVDALLGRKVQERAG